MAEWAFLIPCLISRLYRVLNFTFLSLLSIPTYFMSMTKKLDCQFCFYQHLSSHMIIYIIMGTWKPPFAFTDHPVYLPTITEERSMLLLGVQHVQQCLVRYFSTFELSSYWNYYCSVFMFFYYYISIWFFYAFRGRKWDFVCNIQCGRWYHPVTWPQKISEWGPGHKFSHFQNEWAKGLKCNWFKNEEINTLMKKY